MVSAIRSVEAALGNAVKRPAGSELATAAVARKSLHWSRGLIPGDAIEADDLVALRPGTGIAPSRRLELVGRRVRLTTVAGSLVRTSDLEQAPDAKG
jgi:sialic acid synthase SpsE